MELALSAATEELSSGMDSLEQKISTHSEFISGFHEKLTSLQFEVDSMDSGQFVELNENAEEDEDDG